MTLDEAARRTGVAPSRLRLWCATGLLDCDLVDGEWRLSDAAMDAALRLAARRSRIPAPADGQVVVGAVFGSLDAAWDAAERLRSARVPLSDVAAAPLALDSAAAVLLGLTIPARHADVVARTIDEAGGSVVAAMRAERKEVE